MAAHGSPQIQILSVTLSIVRLPFTAVIVADFVCHPVGSRRDLWGDSIRRGTPNMTSLGPAAVRVITRVDQLTADVIATLASGTTRAAIINVFVSCSKWFKKIRMYLNLI